MSTCWSSCGSRSTDAIWQLRIYRNLHGVPVPVDVVVVTEDDVLQFGNKPGTVLYPALKEGIVVYEA